MRRDRGATLLELLITVTIVMILASVATPLAKVSGKRAKELALRQDLRTVRAAIDAFKTDWNREGDVPLGQLCAKNKLACKEVSGTTGYPKSLDVLLSIKLTGPEAALQGATVKRYLRAIPRDPMTGKTDWILRCSSDPPDASVWCGADVYDLSSVSQETSLDGASYRSW